MTQTIPAPVIVQPTELTELIEQPVDLVVEDVLVEEVSIDGMCGVY